MFRVSVCMKKVFFQLTHEHDDFYHCCVSRYCSSVLANYLLIDKRRLAGDGAARAGVINFLAAKEQL